MTLRSAYLLLLTLFIVLPLSGCGDKQVGQTFVSDQESFRAAVRAAQPGDTIVLENGVWRDFEILFTGEGTSADPITLTAETKGKVILSGASNLRIAGSHLVVSGLVFRDGYTPTGEVIAFREHKDHLANYSRVTEVVIDRYNNPERRENDTWVTLYGKGNRFDHNHLVGKRNRGVTVAVRLDSEASQENAHSIDHNYFGPRPILGSNGGETLRIGTSHYSLTRSNTVVENNYFDRTNGELEIISVKSGGNTIRGNTFFEARGTLTLRHGNGNIVEDNVFFGNGKDHTGGIRVINADQTVRNNYMEGLQGYRFGGALVVMNGVPNSPINRYHQVNNAVIANNSIIASDHIQLAAGSDAERSAVPVNSSFKRNLIVNTSGRDIFTLYDDVSGIQFEDNLVNSEITSKIGEGFTVDKVTLSRAATGLLLPDEGIVAGVRRDLVPVARDATGVRWYAKDRADIAFGSGQTIEVAPGVDTLTQAVQAATAGDTLVLLDGDYSVNRVIGISVPVTIRAARSAAQAEEGGVAITFSRTALFEIQDGGSLKLQGLKVSGASAPDAEGNSVIRTTKYGMLQNYRLRVEHCAFTSLDKNHSFSFLNAAQTSLADDIAIKESSFRDVTGAILKLDGEIDDYGIYNAEYVTIVGSEFVNVEGPVASLYRGGTDESTFGPHFHLKNSRFHSVGRGKRNKAQASILLHGVQVAKIEGNEFRSSAPITINHTVGEPVTMVENNRFIASGKPQVTELNSDAGNTAIIRNNTDEEGY
jgi:poly(beta-D-mannuronate) lyase